eukprot:GDKI01004156.1.p1 GENE.GDKI01004156.1~~GDKI01004156.1.p1  ORF type:complete len:343 (+),score=79.15 GDKI01004156.1:123-1151(+)
MDRMPAPQGLPPKANVSHHIEAIREDEEEQEFPEYQGGSVGFDPRLADKLPTWDMYFDSKEDVVIDGDSFRVYQAGSSGPVVFCLHGGGHSALSWAIVASLVKRHMTVVAYDCRGHGGSVCRQEEDFSADVLVNDGVNVITHVFERLCKQLSEGARKPDVAIVGHSMGGAIAARIAATGRIPNLKGLCVVDVVEGTALEALPHMHSVVSRLPTAFENQREAVTWAVKSGTLLNRESASVSVPSQLTHDTHTGLWRWRCDLMKTQPFWDGWFRGMSNIFLSAPCTKLLILAGNDRLDKPLLIAQMQGRFQLTIVPHSGHVVEEDQPQHVAESLIEFVRRYQLH